MAVLITLFAALLVGGYIWKSKTVDDMPIAHTKLQRYSNETYGISFTYPNSYILDEREVGNGERRQFAITLMDKIAAANIPKNGEGPPSIALDVIQNDLDNLSVTEWVNNDSRSNFKLSPDRVLASTTVAGREAVRYIWNGLYRGRSVVFEHGGDILMISVSSFEPTDAIYSDFAEILSSFQLN